MLKINELLSDDYKIFFQAHENLIKTLEKLNERLTPLEILYFLDDVGRCFGKTVVEENQDKLTIQVS